MQSVSRRGRGPAGLLALAFVLMAPALASAQLFPNLPIRRERVPCDQENPQFRNIRQEYWGYYPTCWRKFPPGWGCPSPEAPNWEAEKRRQKLDLGPATPDASAAPRNPKDGEDTTKPFKPSGTLPDLPPDNGGIFKDDIKPPPPKPDAPANPGGSASSGNAPLGSTDGTPTASNANRRGRGFISGLGASMRR